MNVIARRTIEPETAVAKGTATQPGPIYFVIQLY